MRIAIKGRNLHVSERLKEHVDRRFAKVGRQVSELAELELELYEERNPSNPDAHVAEATLHLKGVTLRRATPRRICCTRSTSSPMSSRSRSNATASSGASAG